MKTLGAILMALALILTYQYGESEGRKAAFCGKEGQIIEQYAIMESAADEIFYRHDLVDRDGSDAMEEYLQASVAIDSIFNTLN